MGKNKKVISKHNPAAESICSLIDVEAYYNEHPSWCFNSCDKMNWKMNKHDLWKDIIPKLQSLEKQTWNEILIMAKKNNHSIETNLLNKAARDRLSDLHVEAEALISIRLSSTHRLYGYMQKTAFCILWYDTDHGDNTNCVCRSHKKHT